MITEFMFYLSISHFIMALPIAVLISSVMVMGNLAEHYELSSLKSAGDLCAAIAMFSWMTANFLTPVANLKFKSRLYDMRKQKPTMNMEVGIFNDDFEGYRVRIGEKGADNKTIKDVFIANHISSQKDRLNEIIADGGIMYNTPDERFLVMELENGEQFQEGNRFSNNKTKAPFVRTSFEKYIKIFDMSEFDINRTDEELFRTHYSMLSMSQLQTAIDSIDQQMFDRRKTVSQYVDQYIKSLQPDTVKTEPAKPSKELDSLSAIYNKKVDSLALKKKATNLSPSSRDKFSKKTKVELKKGKKVATKKRKTSKIVKLKTQVTPQTIDKPLKEYDSIIEIFGGGKRESYANKAKQHARSIKSNAESAQRYLVKTKEKRIKHVFELYSKYAFAMVCFVFLFIGAPMGALVRKGGFGYPLLIAIIFFMLFITLTLTFKRMAEAFVVPTLLAVWLPNLIILPIGFFLTYKAMNDSKVFDTTRFMAFVQMIKDRLPSKKSA